MSTELNTNSSFETKIVNGQIPLDIPVSRLVSIRWPYSVHRGAGVFITSDKILTAKYCIYDPYLDYNRYPITVKIEMKPYSIKNRKVKLNGRVSLYRGVL